MQKAFDPSQPRDDDGKWPDEGGGGGSASDAEKEHRRATVLRWVKGALTIGLVASLAIPVAAATSGGVAAYSLGFVGARFAAGAAVEALVAHMGVSRVVALGMLSAITDGLIAARERELEKDPSLAKAADLILQRLRGAKAALAAYGEEIKKSGGGNPNHDELDNPSQPRSLYISRRLLNEGAVRAWAREQGFESALPAGDVHVTIAYSKEPVNWSAIEPDRDALAVQGGARSVHQFDGGAVVLTLESPELQRRWQELRDAGASWDYPDYRPHVTITYSGVPADLSAVEPYRGPLIFGPEEMEEVDPEGFDPDSIEEEALLKALYGIRRRGSIPRRTSRRM